MYQNRAARQSRGKRDPKQPYARNREQKLQKSPANQRSRTATDWTAAVDGRQQQKQLGPCVTDRRSRWTTAAATGGRHPQQASSCGGGADGRGRTAATGADGRDGRRPEEPRLPPRAAARRRTSAVGTGRNGRQADGTTDGRRRTGGGQSWRTGGG